MTGSSVRTTNGNATSVWAIGTRNGQASRLIGGRPSAST